MLWCNTTVYYGSGYSDIVGRMVEDKMNEAVSEVKALPNYAENGEVLCEFCEVWCAGLIFCNSGSLLMHGMTLQPMPTTLRFHVCQEG
jgi:hypothetical protein